MMVLGYSTGLRSRRPALLAAVGLVTIAIAPMAAQIDPVAPVQIAAAKAARGIAAAYDPTKDRYLVVGAMNHVIAVLVNAQGLPVSSIIEIQGNSPKTPNNPKTDQKPYGSFPRVAYSPALNGGQGGFLVVWAQEKSSTTQLHMRVVTSNGVVLGSDGDPETNDDIVVSDSNAWKDALGAAIAYSSTSQTFMLAWKVSPKSNAVIRVQRVKVDNASSKGASLVGPSVAVSTGFGRDPGIAWNPTNDEFGVSYGGENGTKRFVGFVRVPANNPSNFVRRTFNELNASTVAATDISFNPHTGRYVMSWWQSSGGGRAMIAEVSETGTVVAMGTASTNIGSYDALSSAFNPISRTFLLSGLGADDDIFSAELNGRGFRISSEENMIQTSEAAPGRYTRVEASTTSPRWINLVSRNFGQIWDRVVKTDTTNGGAAGNHPPPGSAGGTGGGGGGTGGGGTTGCTTSKPVWNWVCVGTGWLPPTHPMAIAAAPPPPPPAQAKVHIDGPTGGTVGNTFAVAGWAFEDPPVNSVTGINAVYLYAYPGCVGCAAPIAIGPAVYGQSRPDVADFFGDARLTHSGFSCLVTLPNGVYDLVVFARKTSDQKWVSKVVRITVN
jgi:hypothetical protein